jgi:RNA polymerase sigma-70 factor (ECF subfamily)
MGGMETPIARAESVLGEVAVVPTSFEDLFADEHQKLFRALYLIIGSSHEAEELMQDSFLRVLERWDNLLNPTGYLYRTALNATRSRFRRLKMAATRTLAPGEPEDLFAAADLRDAVVRALKELPGRQRAALVLVDMLDYSSTEASTFLGVTPATVRSLASHARASLKVTMEMTDD